MQTVLDSALVRDLIIQRRLGLDANELRREHTSVVNSGLQQKEARHGAAAAAAGASALQREAVDCLLAGLAITVTTCLYSGVRYGFLGQRIAECPTFHGRARSGWGLLQPLQLLRPLQVVACWVFTTGDVMIGVRIPPWDFLGQFEKPS